MTVKVQLKEGGLAWVIEDDVVVETKGANLVGRSGTDVYNEY